MVNPEKVYLMTKAAFYEKKEKRGELRIVNYLRKDYVFSRTLLTLFAVTVAYLLLIGTIFFIIVMETDAFILNLAEMILLILLVVIGYIFVCVLYYIIARRFFGNRHREAKKNVRRYLEILKKLDEM